MHRRFLFPLAAGIVGLLAISPVLAAEPKAPDKSPAPTKASTSTTADPGGRQRIRPTTDSGRPTATAATGADRRDNSATRLGLGLGIRLGLGWPAVVDRSATRRRPSRTRRPRWATRRRPTRPARPGSVDVERLSETELRVAGANANDGWTEQVATPSGPRVTVKFTRQGQSPSLIRFAATMDQRGTMIHVRVTNCG